MTNNKQHAWCAALALVALALCGTPTAAQLQDDPNPWRYPGLTKHRQFQRWWWAYSQRTFPTGTLSREARPRAIEQLRAHQARLAARAILPSPTQGDTWVPIGPAPVTFAQTSPPSAVSGRVAEIAVDPTNANRWLIGAAQGGVWETTDAGATWVSRTDDQASLAMGAIAFSLSNPSIVYAGTGEAVNSGDAYGGAGVLKSIDGGSSWTLLAASTFSGATFADIAVHPTNSDAVVAATSIGLYQSFDGGVSWTQTLANPISDLEIDPTDFSRQYAATGGAFAGGAVYRSIDSGGTWALISGPWAGALAGPARTELALAPSDPNVVYASVADGFNGVGADGASIGLWKTTNAWDAVPTWTAIAYTAPIPAGGYCGTQCWYDNDLKVDPTSADVLYAGGLSMWKFDGTVWSDVLHGMHVDQQSMAWVGTRLIAGNDGGLWSSTNGGTSWTNHNAGLQITQFYYGSIHPGEVAFAIAGSQDNGTEKWNGTTPWSFYYFGDGATTAIAKNNPTTHWAVSSQYLDIRHTMTGTFPSAAKAGIDPTNAPFISRFEKCPGNDDVFIAGTDNLWKTTNFFTAGVTWSSNGPDIGAITALTFAPSDPTCSTYVYSASGLLQLTTDGGTTWTNPDPFGQLPYRYVTDLGFDPTDANVLYVTFSAFDEDTPSTPGHLFRTANALSGTPTWSNISPPVNLPHNTVAIDPSAPSSLFAGTDIGVWWTPNLGTDWYQMGPSAGMPNVAVFDLQISDSGTSVIAFTHGRGAFLLGGPQPPPPSFELDHYKCYQGTDLKNPKLERVSSTLNDQITTEVVLLQKLKYICTPVDTNGENINDPTAHLACYQVKGETLSPRPHVQLSSQFQASKFEIKKPKLLCVPSTKTVLP